MSHRTALDDSPHIHDFVVEQWQNRFKNYSTFTREMNWMIKQVNHVLLEEPNQQSQQLVEELVFILAFGTKQMIDDYCNQPEVA